MKAAILADQGPPVNTSLTLVTEQGTARAAALDSVTMVRDPFPIVNTHNFSSDQRTRITLFATNLQLMTGEDASAVTVRAENSQGRLYSLPVEYVGGVPNLDWMTQGHC